MVSRNVKKNATKAPPSKVGWAQKQNDFATQTKKLCHDNGAERHFLGCLREASTKRVDVPFDP
jgi:hypothetical protein